MNIYHAQLMDHYQNPRNKGNLENPTFTGQAHNSLCGDSIIFEGTIEKNIIVQEAFRGSGCVLSQATASLLTIYIHGKTVEEVMCITAQQIQDLVQVHVGPTRLKCLLLPLQALQHGISFL